MIKQFKKDYPNTSIITYADKRYTSEFNNVYLTNGFKLLSHTKPNYWYVKKLNREHRFNYTKQKLVNKGFDKNKTEKQIMKDLKYNRIYDCGSLKYILD